MPVLNCCVPDCKADTRKHGKYDKYPWMKDVQFLAFPKGQREKMLWVRRIRRPDSWRPSQWTRICTRHFIHMKTNIRGKLVPSPEHPYPVLFPRNNWDYSEVQMTVKRTPNKLQQSVNTRCLLHVPEPVLEVEIETNSDRCVMNGIIEQKEETVHSSDVENVFSQFENAGDPHHVPEPGVEILIPCELPRRHRLSVGPRMAHSDITPHPRDHTYTRLQEIPELDYRDTGTQADIPSTSKPAKRDSGSQTTLSSEDIERMLKREDDKSKLMRLMFTQVVLKDDSSVKRYTGLTSLAMFYMLFEILIKHAGQLSYWRGKATTQHRQGRKKPGPQRLLTHMDEFIITLVRLRVGLSTVILADLFGTSQSRISQVFTTWIKFMYMALSPVLQFPSQKSVRRCIPKSFKKSYPRTRALIDCTEIYIQKPRTPVAQAATYSTYKSHNTFKLLVAIEPNGAFSFVSKLWGGNISDRHITEHSGFLQLVEPGDDIMADRGFSIRDLLLKKKATLNMPPNTRKPKTGTIRTLNIAEIKKTRKIASLRIHVERAIERLKDFKLLSNTLPLRLKSVADQMVTVVAVLCNLDKPLVK